MVVQTLTAPIFVHPSITKEIRFKTDTNNEEKLKIVFA